MIYITQLLPNYMTLLGIYQIMDEHSEYMLIKGKDDSSSVLPSCPTCRATMDLKLLQSFGSRHISNDGKLYYCNNPMCAPDEEEGKHRLLPFSWNSHHHHHVAG
jgi:hypothetical protein